MFRRTGCFGVAPGVRNTLATLFLILGALSVLLSAQAVCQENLLRVKNSHTSGHLENIVAIDAGWMHFVALKYDGTVWTWGLNSLGQLGDGTNRDRHSAVQVITAKGDDYLSGVVAVAAGDYHTMALRYDGTVWAWGRNEFGQLGNGAGGWGRFCNRAIQTGLHSDSAFLGNIIAISAGHEHSVAVALDGSVWTWGDNYFGQLGDGSNYESHLPVKVIAEPTDSSEGIIEISAAHEHTLALDGWGRLYAWGWNEFGQLGDGTNTSRNTPVPVSSPDGSGLLSGVISVSAGYYRSYAIRESGSILAWGWNRFGQLGDCTTIDRNVPVCALGFSKKSGGGVSKIDAGFEHTAFLINDSELCLLGRISILRHDSKSRTSTVIAQEEVDPVHYKYFPGIVDVAAGGISTAFLMDDGTVWICCYANR